MSACRVCLLLALAGPVQSAVYSGRVLEDHSGSPLSRVEIRFTRPNTAGIVAETETDAQGRFRTPDLPAGEYQVRAARINYSSVTLRARPDLSLRLIRYGSIAGHVLDAAGHPAAFAQIAAITESGQTNASATDGEYRIFGLPPGRYRIAVLNQSREVRSGVVFFPNNSQPREFTIAGGEDYTGADFLLPDTVTYTVSGTADTALKLLDLVSAEQPQLRVAHTVARQDGTFQFEHVSPGRYEVLGSSMQAPQFGRVPLVVSGPDAAVSVPAVPKRAAAFTLRADKACGSEATVSLAIRDGWMAAQKPSLALHEGRPATLPSLAPGRYTVTAASPVARCFASVNAALDLTQESAPEPIEVVLAPPSSIQGQLAGAAHPSDYVAVLIPADGGPIRVEYPGEDGRFTFDDLAPGRYFVHAVPAATGRWMPADGKLPAPTEVGAGAPVQLEIRVTEAAR